MSFKNTMERFKREVAECDQLPKDLELLVWATATEAGTPYDELGLVAILPDEREELLEEFVFGHSYLSEDEKRDPQIQANIAAIREVARLITFVAKDEEDNFYGYWHGKQGRPLQNAPIVQYDTEGQFHIMPGTSLTESFTAQYCFDNDDLFNEIKEGFAKLEFFFQYNSWQEVYDHETEIEDDAANLHDTLYNAHLK